MAPDRVSGEGADLLPTRPGLIFFYLCWVVLAVAGCLFVWLVMMAIEIDSLREELDAKAAVIESHERRLNAAEAELRQRRNDSTRAPVKPPEERD